MSRILVLNGLTKVQQLANKYYDSKTYYLVGFYRGKRRPDHNPEKTTIKYILFIKCRQLLTNYF